MASPELEDVVATLFEMQARMPADRSMAEMREGFETFWRTFPPEPGIEPEAVSAGGVPAAWIVAPEADDARVMLYLHGGGFCAGSILSHLAITTRLTGAAKARVLALDYRLAPEHHFPAQIDDAVAAYTWLLDQDIGADRIVVAGDSAGGGLVVTGMLAMRERGLPMPACAVAISPWTDLVGDGAWRDADPTIDPTANAGQLDEIIENYLDGADPRQGLASPVFADLTGLPPMLIQVGTREILKSDATRLADRARDAGVDVTLEIEEGAFHVWHHAAPRVPESLAAIGRIGAFVRRHVD